MRIGIEWAELGDPVDVGIVVGGAGEAVSVSDLGGCVGGVRSGLLRGGGDQLCTEGTQDAGGTRRGDTPGTACGRAGPTLRALGQKQIVGVTGWMRSPRIILGNEEFQGQVHPRKPPLAHSGTRDCLLSL